MDIEKIPEFENCNIVLLGSFNPAIFHPEWFVRQNLAGVDAVDPETITVVSTDVTECQVGPVRVFCDDSRLMLSVSNMAESDKLLDMAIGCLQILAHVPVAAVGINNQAVFKADNEEQWHKIGHTLAPKEPVWNNLGKDPGMQQVAIKYLLQASPPMELTVKVEPHPQPGPKHPAIRITSNLHYQLHPPGSVPSDGSSTELAIDFVRTRWKEATSNARRVAAAIFGQILS